MKTKRRSVQLHPESLETRRLMAADISLDGGVLNIRGTNRPDTIEVAEQGTKVTAYVTTGEDVVQLRFHRSDVRSLVVHGRGGDDGIINDTRLPAKLDGGEGDDVILGGSGVDRIFAGKGDDLVFGESGNDMIYGGSGDDRIYAGSGHDEVDAGSGADHVWGASGDDEIYGGSGDDLLDGGSGDDFLSGGSGRDTLFGGRGWDELYGGAGVDRIDVAASHSPAESLKYGAVSKSKLSRIIDAAISNWRDADASRSMLANMRQAKFGFIDLPESKLGLTLRRHDGSSIVWLDRDADGQGWFVDSSPMSDREFDAVNDTVFVADSAAAAKGVDLLTVVSHELGHVGGLPEVPSATAMNPELAKGVRFMPHANLSQMANLLTPSAGHFAMIPNYQPVPTFLTGLDSVDPGSWNLFLNPRPQLANLYSGLLGLTQIHQRSQRDQPLGFSIANDAIPATLNFVNRMSNPNNFRPNYGNNYPVRTPWGNVQGGLITPTVGYHGYYSQPSYYRPTYNPFPFTIT